jgi:hypothetical protein
MDNISITPFSIYPGTTVHKNPENYGIDKTTLPKSYFDRYLWMWKTENRRNTFMIRTMRFLIAYVTLYLFELKRFTPDVSTYRFFVNI